MTRETEVEMVMAEESASSDSVWSKFQQDQSGAIEKIIGIAIVVVITVGALGVIGAVIKNWADEVPEPGEVETGF